MDGFTTAIAFGGPGAVFWMWITVLVVVGASIPLKLVWNLADIANIFMAVPNLIAVVLLVGVVKILTDEKMYSLSAQRFRLSDLDQPNPLASSDDVKNRTNRECIP